MPRPHPREFRDDVVAVARKGEAPIAQLAVLPREVVNG